MRIALLSDVHGNLPAFEAVLADVDASGAEEIWCLGDLVGYGAEPDGCVELARERCDLCLAGNHDLVVTGEIDLNQTDLPDPVAKAIEQLIERLRRLETEVEELRRAAKEEEVQ